MKILNRVNQLFWLSIFVIISIGCGKTKTTDIKSNPYAYKEYVNGFTANAIKESAIAFVSFALVSVVSIFPCHNRSVT